MKQRIKAYAQMILIYVLGFPFFFCSLPRLYGLCLRRDCIGKFAVLVIKKKIQKQGSFIGNPLKLASWPIFPHGCVGVFISDHATVGRDCVIFQQVTIGSNTLPDSKGFGFPVIGDNVYIGAGAKIVGNVHVGNNCRIGANAVVVKDVPENSTVYLNNICCVQKESVMDNRFWGSIIFDTTESLQKN